MTLQNIILEQYEELNRRGLIVLQGLIEQVNITAIDKYLVALEKVIKPYEITTHTSHAPEQSVYADTSFFERDPIDVARELIGAKIYSGGQEKGTIRETGAYKGHASRKMSGLEYGAGKLYIFPMQGGKTTLVINTEREGEASVITIRGLEVEGTQKAVTEVVPHLGLNKSHNNQLFSDAGLAIELHTSIPSSFISRRDALNQRMKMPNNCLGNYYLKI